VVRIKKKKTIKYDVCNGKDILYDLKTDRRLLKIRTATGLSNAEKGCLGPVTHVVDNYVLSTV